jgi:hypothetical protein
MDDQTAMNTNGRKHGTEPSVATSVAGLTHDVIELAELQGQLFALAVKHTTKNVESALVMTVVGACLLIGAVHVGLIALAEFLIAEFGWTKTSGYGVATLIGVVISLGVLGVAWAQLRSGFGALNRSREELKRNIAWIKSNLRSRATANSGTGD